MAEELSIESLRAAIQGTAEGSTAADEAFEALARRFERAVAKLVDDVERVVRLIPELTVTREDEEERFTSPAFPGREIGIRSQRLRITRGVDVLLLDPTARALLSALGQVEVQASRPLPFMVDKMLYLLPEAGGERTRWAYRPAEGLGGPPVPFTQQALLRLLQAVFVTDPPSAAAP